MDEETTVSLCFCVKNQSTTEDKARGVFLECYNDAAVELTVINTLFSDADFCSAVHTVSEP